MVKEMNQVNGHEAKTQLSQLGELAWQREETGIEKAGKPNLRLVPYQEPPVKRGQAD